MGHRRVLITGGAGFIGSHLTDAFLQAGTAVTVVDDFSTGRLENLARGQQGDSLTVLEGDIRDPALLTRALEGVDAVLHLAAVVSVPYSMEWPQATFDVNLRGTERVLEACVHCGVDRVLFASTCAIYGEPQYLPIDERHPTQPLSPYAQSKLAAEVLCLRGPQAQRMKVTVLRLFNVYGPRQSDGPYSGVITQFLRRLTEGTAPVIFGDGQQTRDFVYVTDVVHAFLQALHQPAAVGRVFNVATGTPTTLRHLAHLMIHLFKAGDLQPVYADTRPGDIRNSYANIHAAQQALGFRPQILLDTGLATLIPPARPAGLDKGHARDRQGTR